MPPMPIHIPGYRFLHSPGPTHVPEAVLNAISRQPMDLGDPRVDAVTAACENGLRQLLGNPQADVFLYAANGHGVWEATTVNLLAPGATVLIPGTGHFSESWAVMSEALGVRVLRTPYREGYPLDAAEVAQVLRDDAIHEIVAVFAVHTDTASATTNDLAALRQALDDTGHPALFVVDAVATLGAAPLDMVALRANVVLSASQKGLMTPPGVGLCVVDAQAFAVSVANPRPRFYWDWRLRQSEHGYRKFCGTPPLNLLMGLEAALGLIAQESLDAVWARHRQLADATHAAVQAWRTGGALDFLCRVPEARSVSVTAVLVDVDAAHGVLPEDVRRVAREDFQVAIAGGLGPFAGRVFRIGHLGDLNAPMLLGCLAGIEGALVRLGVPIGRGGVEQAVNVLNRAPVSPRG
jgi:alanine-glyoxylate transaminase / serine-glyoxylate transaminase / serine-pyruvate transaminase